jgi:uridine kinase
MRVAFLITGIPRQFSKNLKLYLDSLDTFLDYDIYIYFPKENIQENYANEMFNPETFLTILKNPRYKLILIDTNLPPIPDNLSRKQKNSIIQWYRIQKCFSFIPDIYDFVIRIRPDIKLLINPDEFCSILQKISTTELCIPTGFDIDSSSYNDHFAIGSYHIMKEYCSLFNSLSYSHEYQSEHFLYNYLTGKNISVLRVAIPYKVSLSDCKVIAIAGDSASGKSTFMNYIQEILPQESYLSIETDSYHKWERHDENWKQYTHLNPDANNLERMSEDVLRLKIGNNVSLVEYDHNTGKFLQEKITCAKPFLILCGLHTLYKKNLLKDLDLKIFLNTEEHLKIDWKVKRDMKERNYTLDKIMETILKRKEDSDKYIQPQKDAADIIITYFLENSELVVKVEMTPILSSIVHPFCDFFSDSSLKSNSLISYTLKNTITSSELSLKLKSLEDNLYFVPTTAFQDGTTGVLQFIIFLIMFYNYE